MCDFDVSQYPELLVLTLPLLKWDLFSAFWIYFCILAINNLFVKPKATLAHLPHPQLSIKSAPVYTSPTSSYNTFLESLIQPGIYRVNIRGHFNPTPINRVNNAISNAYRLTYKFHTFLEMSGPI